MGGERGRVEAGAFGGEEDAEFAWVCADGGFGGGECGGEERWGWETASGEGLRFEVVRKLLGSGCCGGGGVGVETQSGLGRDDDNGRGEGACGQGQVDARAGDRVKDDGGVREEGCKGQAEAVGVGEDVGGQEGVGGGEAVDCGQ